MVAEERFAEQRSVKSTDDDSLSKYQDALQDLDLDTAPEAREYLLRVLGMNPTEADEELLRASLPRTMHHAYYTNHMKPWIQIKTHNRHNQHARAERGPPQVVGERAGTNHSQVPHPGLYAVRMNNPKFPVGVRSTMYPQYENRSNQSTPQNKQHRSRSKKWTRRRVNGKWTKVPVKQPAPKMSDAEKLLKEVNELTTQLFEQRLNYWMKEAKYVADTEYQPKEPRINHAKNSPHYQRYLAAMEKCKHPTKRCIIKAQIHAHRVNSTYQDLLRKNSDKVGTGKIHLTYSTPGTHPEAMAIAVRMRDSQPDEYLKTFIRDINPTSKEYQEIKRLEGHYLDAREELDECNRAIKEDKDKQRNRNTVQANPRNKHKKYPNYAATAREQARRNSKERARRTTYEEVINPTLLHPPIWHMYRHPRHEQHQRSQQQPMHQAMMAMTPPKDDTPPNLLTSLEEQEQQEPAEVTNVTLDTDDNSNISDLQRQLRQRHRIQLGALSTSDITQPGGGEPTNQTQQTNSTQQSQQTQTQTRGNRRKQARSQ